MKALPEKQAPVLRPCGTLCSTCLDGPFCGLHCGPVSPVFYCEEFSLPESPQPPPIQPRRNPDCADCDPSPVLGLCKTCANYHRCAFSKPLGGVWHCEEFA